MSVFNLAVQALLTEEGGAYVPNDNGRGPSRWGVTLMTYQAFYPSAVAKDIFGLTPEEAIAFYRAAYWVFYQLGLIDDQDVATKMLDLTVNVGRPAICWLQNAAGVVEDGMLGPVTAAAVNAMVPQQVLTVVRKAGATYYNNLAVQDPAKYGPDLAGWLARLAK